MKYCFGYLTRLYPKLSKTQSGCLKPLDTVIGPFAAALFITAHFNRFVS